MKVLIAGAGITGATIARLFAERGTDVVIRDGRDHVAGNCHTAVDAQTGVLEHVYGPHLFHTDDTQVFNWLGRHTTWMPYEHRVKAVVEGEMYSLPVNLHTICQVYNNALTPTEALEMVIDDRRHPAGGRPCETFEEEALATVGKTLYELFFEGYTIKQWGRHPRELPASVARRLPLRFNFDDRYFSDAHQALPGDGYTAMIERMLSHDRITVELESPVDPAERADCDVLVWTGPLDEYFGYAYGRLEYRTLDFHRQVVDVPDFQGTSVVNYCDVDVPHTRITEHAHLTPWPRHPDAAQTLIVSEVSRLAEPGDVPFYPVRLAVSLSALEQYEKLAQAETGVAFAGRLGLYKYLDMAPAVRAAIEVTRTIIAQQEELT